MTADQIDQLLLEAIARVSARWAVFDEILRIARERWC